MRNSAALLSLTSLVACVPTHSMFLHIPIKVDAPRPDGPVIVRLSIAEVARRMDDFDVERIAVFDRGRRPVPHQLVDSDHDGKVDTILVKLAAGIGDRWVAIVCPAHETSDEKVPAGGSAAGVTIDYIRSKS